MGIDCDIVKRYIILYLSEKRICGFCQYLKSKAINEEESTDEADSFLCPDFWILRLTLFRNEEFLAPFENPSGWPDYLTH